MATRTLLNPTDRMYLEQLVGHKVTCLEEARWSEEEQARALRTSNLELLHWLCVTQTILPLYPHVSRHLTLPPDVELHRLRFKDCVLASFGRLVLSGCDLRRTEVRLVKGDELILERCSGDQTTLEGEGWLRMSQSHFTELRAPSWQGGLQLSQSSLHGAEMGDIHLFEHGSHVLDCSLERATVVSMRLAHRTTFVNTNLMGSRLLNVRGDLQIERCATTGSLVYVAPNATLTSVVRGEDEPLPTF